jgi:hypothetical protein
MKTRAKPPSHAPLFTAADVAELLKIDPQTVRVWARKGKLPPPRRIGTGRTLRWAPSDLNSLLGEREGAADDQQIRPGNGESHGRPTHGSQARELVAPGGADTTRLSRNTRYVAPAS